MNLSRRHLLGGLVAIPLTTALIKPSLATTSIAWQGFRGDGHDFFRAPVLLTGQDEAMLIDGSFNLSSGQALTEAIQATGKRLTTIIVTCNDPDYYFSLKPVANAFPEARIIGAPETIALMRKKAPGKLETWRPVLGDNGPQKLDDLIFPQPFDGTRLDLEGSTIEIVTSATMEDRRYLWVDDLKAVFGGVYLFENLHVWTADTRTPVDRANWIAEIDALAKRRPEVVVAGHAADIVDNGPDSLIFTRDYLIAFEEEVAKAANSGDLIAAMKRRYPGLGLEKGLEISAKVATGEMSWG